MWKFGAVVALMVGWAGSCWAADQVNVGAPAAWVKVAEPLAAPPASDGAAVRFIRLDTQLHFGPDGTAVYSESAVRIQAPQGLEALSTLTLPWNPEFGTLTIHKLQIVRDGQVIDLLAKQKFTVIRRENNLENAMLDGVLTAVLQPEDLRVGDVLNLAYTTTETDPALAGHAQWVLAPPNVAVDDLRLAGAGGKPPLRWLASEGLDGLKPDSPGEGAGVSVRMKAVQPVIPPKDAPQRFQMGRLLQISDFKSWAEVSALMAPLFDKAATLGAVSPLKVEIDKIKAASSDPKVRAEAALALVQDQIRYVALNINDGGLVPADAETTWKRRFGDCKGKTALLLALLRGLGIEAQPSLVDSTGGDGMDARLPMVAAFDHVLVRAVIGGKVYWLDGTRMGDRRLDDIRIPTLFWTLPVQAQGARLLRLEPPPLDRPSAVRTVKLDASKGLDVPAAAQLQTVLRGDEAFVTQAALANLSPAQRDVALREYWSKAYSSMTLTKVGASYDPMTGEETLTAEGRADMSWRPGNTCCRTYEADGYVLGWDADFNRTPGPHADAPFAAAYPTWAENNETIILPNQGKGFTLEGEDVDRRVGAWAFLRKSGIEKGVFTMRASERSLAAELPATDALAAAETIKAMSKVGVYLVSPNAYQMTKEELDQYEAKSLTTFDDLLQRGETLMQKGRTAQGRSDLEKAIALNPKSVRPQADLAVAKAAAQDFRGAHIALKAILGTAPEDLMALRAAAYIASLEADYPTILEYDSRILAKQPEDQEARRRRAGAYWGVGDFDKSLADYEILLKADPKNASLRGYKTTLLLASDHADRALADIDADLVADPKAANLHSRRANVLRALGRFPEADADLDRALALNPTAQGRLNRAFARRADDLKGRLADIEEALRLEPNNAVALSERAGLEAQIGRPEQALTHIEALAAKDADNTEIRIERAFIYTRTGKAAQAVADLDWVRGKLDKANPDVWNSLCYDQAMWNLTLDKALADCDKAVALAPRSSAIQDSRAFVLLRLDRVGEAIAVYDTALKLNPLETASLFGRGVARLKKGMIKEGQADLALARRLQPLIDVTFANYGVSPPATVADSRPAGP